MWGVWYGQTNLCLQHKTGRAALTDEEEKTKTRTMTMMNKPSSLHSHLWEIADDACVFIVPHRRGRR